MEILIKILQLVASLSLLVLVHELGHFMFAKLFKCRVEKFYLFFNPWFSLFKKKIGETEYGIGWLPLGGYCKISGMVDESMDTDQLASEPQPWEFRSKPAWQRLFIIIGGVLMNFLTALVIYIGITYAWGDNYIKTSDVKDGFAFSKAAEEFGFKNGDKILTVDGKEVEAYNQIMSEIILSNKREVEIERDGSRQTIVIPDYRLKVIMETPNFLQLRHPFVVMNVIADDEAAKAGILAGDSLVAVDSIGMKYLDEFQTYFADHKNDTVRVALSREGKIVELPVVINDKGTIGVEVGADLAKVYTISTADYTLLQAIPKGIERGVTQVGNYLKQLKLIVSPETEAYKSVGGFIAIGNIFPSEWSWFAFWNITALLSIMLAVINILPIPALDGGHLVFILYEMITRRKPSQKVMEMAQMVGFFLLIALLLFANGNDIIKLFK